MPSAVAAPRAVLLPQLTAPVVSLAQAADGDHSITLTVSPENLGPVTVRAHISGGAIHIELHAPNDLGRDALRAILGDLRRDLAAAAPHASLLLATSGDGPGSSSQHPGSGSGSANGTAPGTGGGQPGGGAPAGRAPADARPTADARPPTSDMTSPAPLDTPPGGIDVFA
jgi:flagellar hook-length control protein FliK